MKISTPFRVPSLRILVPLALLGATPAALAAPPIEPLAAALRRPLVRLALSRTEPGARLMTRLFGSPLRTEIDVEAVARALGRADVPPALLDDFLARLDALENGVRRELARGAGDALTLIETQARLSLTMTPEAAAGGKLAFVRPAAANGTPLKAARDRFLRGATQELGPAADLTGRDLGQRVLAGRDLRLARLRDARVLSLAGADLSGADLRGLRVLSPEGLRGATYDQFTHLPFSRAEAAARGMLYRPSAPPPGFTFTDLAPLRRRVQAAGAATPKAAIAAPETVLARLDQLSPDHVRGVRLFKRPRNVHPMGTRNVTFEAGVVESSDDPGVRELLEEVRSRGGEVRRLVAISTKNHEVLPHANAYFSTNADIGRPYIALGPAADLPTLRHELEHFRDWASLLERERGLVASELAAAGKSLDPRLAEEAVRFRAMKIWSRPASIRFTEQNAVGAQLRAQKALDEAAGLPLHERQYRFEHRDFVAHISYPEREAIRRVLRAHKLVDLRATPDLAPVLTELEDYARLIVRRGLQSRRSWYRRLRLDSAADVEFETFFQELISTNRSRYAHEGTLDDVRDVFRSVMRSEAEKLPVDEFRRRVLARL